ncbi:hypothetical protein GGD81_004520 [Rhodobium orientis]|uniref:hypothetical protein n=1 Tax=Rhodobium orientis TaxID=34017 RepID=UPI0011B93454|nr:hypothetical protein [Rhodobium orientis]MBB4305443.1 hypothetical protein [Rhodobium orientis]
MAFAPEANDVPGSANPGAPNVVGKINEQKNRIVGVYVSSDDHAGKLPPFDAGPGDINGPRPINLTVFLVVVAGGLVQEKPPFYLRRQRHGSKGKKNKYCSKNSADFFRPAKISSAVVNKAELVDGLNT